MMAPEKISKRCQVKVCGVREAADSEALDVLGVDWIGYNFHPGSARYVDAAAAAAMIGRLRRAIPVGVFVDADPARVAEVIRVTGIRHVQLHGSENLEYIRALAAKATIIKAVPHARLGDLAGLRAAAEKDPKSPPAYFLVDTQSKGGAFGGTGEAFDWSPLSRLAPPRPWFLAGGLGPHNLAAALATHPFAVDLNSKVELAPGRKDIRKVEECLKIVEG